MNTPCPAVLIGALGLAGLGAAAQNRGVQACEKPANAIVAENCKAGWHGQAALVNGMRTDTVTLSPMGMAVADMLPDSAGTWLFHCHVNEHYESGMQTLFHVLP